MRAAIRALLISMLPLLLAAAAPLPVRVVADIELSGPNPALGLYTERPIFKRFRNGFCFRAHGRMERSYLNLGTLN